MKIACLSAGPRKKKKGGKKEKLKRETDGRARWEIEKKKWKERG